MAYTIPELQVLLDGGQIVRDEYLAACSKAGKQPNPARLQLLDILDAVIALIRQVNDVKPKPSEEELKEICLGAYLFCIESIAMKYRLLNPTFLEGYFFNSGSKLYKSFLKYLNINENEKIDDKSKLTYLSAFYNAVFKKHKKIIDENLGPKNLVLPEVEHQVKETIKSTFNYVGKETNKLLKAIPTESAMDSKMSTMLDDYLAASKKEDRKRIAEIVVAISKMIPFDTEAAREHHFLSRSQRIKMGLLLYIMQSIWNEHISPNYLYSPKGNSALYDLCRNALNIESIEDIDADTRRACFAALDTFLADSKKIEELEREVNKLSTNKQYIDITTRAIRKQTDIMIDALSNNKMTSKISPLTIGLATVTAMIASAPGYGSGYAIGYAVGQTNGTVEPKLLVSKLTGYAMTVVIGDAGDYLGYFASNMVIDASLERAFAKVFEALGMLVGAAAGGAIGLVIFDLSYLTLRSLCNLYMDLHSKLDPTLANDFDPKFIECLLSLPPEIFSEEQKLKVQSVTQGGLFSVQSNSKIAEKLLDRGDDLATVVVVDDREKMKQSFG